VAAGAALPVAGYAQFVEPYRLATEKHEFSIAGLPETFDGFRIVQLSDFHFGDFIGAHEVAAAVDVASSLNPDLIALTGDFITSPEDSEGAPVTDPAYTYVALCARELARLKAPHGVFACFGNHDSYTNESYIRAVLGSFNIHVLRNENRAVERDAQRLWLAGIDDAVHGQPDFGKASARIPARETKIMLAHEPDVADETAKYGYDIQLSGHSHGGQIRLPLIGSLYLPSLAKKYPYGYYRVGELQLYTNRGIGMIVLPYRFNAPPEVTLITLRAAPARK